MINHMLSLADQTFHRDGTGMPGGFELFPSLLLAADPGSPRVVPAMGGGLRVVLCLGSGSSKGGEEPGLSALCLGLLGSVVWK